MKNCMTSENISVVNTDATEKLSNRIAVNAKVAQKAKTDIKHPFLKVIQSFFSLESSFSGFAAISEKAITPIVANALNQSDISNIDVGLNSTISDTDISRAVSASYFLENKYKRPEIMSIKPDLSTDAEKPVKAI